MKTKISRIGKKSLSVVIALMMIVSTMLVGMVSVSAVGAYDNGKFKKDDKIYFNFSATGATEVNVLDSGYPDKDYYNNSEFSALTNKTVECTLTNDLDLSTYTARLYGLNNGSWSHYNNNTSKLPSDGQNMVVISADGKSYTWSTYSGSSTTKYAVLKGTTTNGTFTVSPESAAEGATVTVTTSPSSGFEVETVTYTYGTTTGNATGSGNSYEFQMPAANVTVNVTFKQTSTSDTITVYFKNTNNWSNVYCYAWYNDGTDKNTTKAWPGNTMNLIDSTNKVYSIELPGNSTKCVFNPGNDNGKTTDLTIEAGKIFIYDKTDTTDKGYWEDYGSTPSGNYKLADKSGNYGKVVFTVGGNVVTAANENDEVTATVTPNTGFEYVADSFSVTNDTSKEAVGTPSGTTLTFTMPASDVTATAKFALNKAEYVKTLEDGLYVDVAPDKNDTTATFVMWNNYTGVGQDAPASGYAAHNTKDYHTLYIPANVDLGSVTLYNAFSSDVKINGQTVPADGSNTVLLTETTYNADNNNTYKVQVLKGSTSSMFLYTNDGKGNDYDLPTSKKNYTGLLDKDTVKASGGLCTTIKGSTVSDALDLSQVKGRGNSSWEASAKLFGKYAFNMKLSSATSLFNLPKSKSFCLLANNADDAMMRNAYVYQLAKDIGLYDSPEFEFVDIYDNGEYMGAYLITEKVDVADKNKLIKGKSIDDLNEKAGAKFDETNHKRGYASYASDNTVDLDNDANFVKKYQETGTYLLEFEIEARYHDEISWFISNKGQHVVVKSPEFATQGEVEFIKNKFNEMEALVYASTIDLEALSKVMDLDSFARMYLIQEFTANLDSAATSYYITYDCSKGLFVASPVWDYDWALGQNNGTKKAKDDSSLSANNATGWFAKEKAMGDGTQSGSYSLQSKLATDSNFQTVIKKVWNGKNNDGFYAKVQEYYKTDGYLDTWKNQISKSVNMNETRWGFIANNPLRGSAWSYASTNTTNFNNKTGFEGAVEFLKGTSNGGWSKNRVDNLLNNGINAYGNYTQIATPTLTAYAADGTTPLKGEVTAGSTYVLKADTSEIYVDYELYDGETKVGTANTTGVFTIDNATAGIHNYTVKTVYNSTDIKTSGETIVTVSSSPALEGVTLTANPTEVTVGDRITLTAKVTPSTVTGITYTFYQNDVVIGTENTTESTMIVTPETAGDYSYYVVATDGTNTKTSETKTVTVNPLTITGVELTPSKTTVTPGAEFTLTPVVKPSSLTGVTYKFYQSNDNSVTTADDDVVINTVTNNVATVTASETTGTYYYYVVATHTTGEKTSTPVSVKITNEGDVIENVKIRFKGTTLSSLIPYMSVDGGTAAAMTRSTDNPIGTHLSGAYRFVWFEATIPNVTVGQSKTLTFTTSKKSESTMNASITLDFTTCDDNNVIYLAVDNLMSGTTAVDITDNETAKTSFGSAMNMIKQSSASDPVATTLLSTMLKVTSASGQVKTKRYYLGDLDSDNKIGIKDATEIQKSIAGTSELGAEYQSLGDFNADGVVDIKDATAIQKYIAGF